jgi:hypothetical protein
MTPPLTAGNLSFQPRRPTIGLSKPMLRKMHMARRAMIPLYLK